MGEGQPWYDGVDLGSVDQVLLADGKWHTVAVRSFRIGGATFSFSSGAHFYSGPASSVLAIRRDATRRRGEPLRKAPSGGGK
jgi:hypothetical protein